MRILYHHHLSAICRKVRLVLAEKKLEIDLRTEIVADRRKAFLALNPTGEVPVLVEDDGSILAGSDSICEYLDEVYDEPSLLGSEPLQRAETRRLIHWFDDKFNSEVTTNLVGEKLMKRVSGAGVLDSGAIRAGHANIKHHLSYISHLVERRNWLAGDTISLADFTGAAHLSCVDYIGDVPWSDFPEVKDWYTRIKSRPSFRRLLDDQISGIPAARHYRDLDF